MVARLYDGRGLSFAADKPPTGCGTWWSDTFLDQIAINVKAFAIRKPTSGGKLCLMD